jgi:hypothetical protein
MMRTERAGSQSLVAGNNDPGVGLIAAKHHMAALLGAEDEPHALKGDAHLKAGQIGGELGHPAVSRGRTESRLGGLDLDELLACFSGNLIAGVAAVFNVKLDSFTDVFQRLSATITLTYASGQCGDTGDVAAIFFLLQNNRITHWMALSL